MKTRMLIVLFILSFFALPLYGGTERPSLDCPDTCHTSAYPPVSKPSRLGFGAEVRGSHVLNVLNIYENLLTRYDFASPVLTVSFNTFPSDNCYWARSFNYPTFYAGFSWSPYHALGSRQGCSLGDMYNLFGGAAFSALRSGCFSTGPFMEMGFCYASNIYDPVTNMRNRYVGGHLDGMISLGWNFSFFVAKRWEINLGAGFTHHSIGKMFLPNSGVTEAAVSLGLRYHLDAPFMGMPGDTKSIEPLYDKGLRWYVYAAGGLHSCQSIWTAEGKWERTIPCVRAILGADAAWRYHPIFSSGIGFNIQYTSGIDRLRQADAVLHPESTDVPYSPIQVGADLLQQFHYRGFSLHLRLGVYLFKQQGIEEEVYTGRFYQKVGLRYDFASAPVFLGLDMKVHQFNSSDCLELSVGVNLGKKR